MPLGALVLLIGCLPFVYTWPPCSGCLSDHEITQPGFGIDLTLEYGTIAVRFHNGSSTPIAKVKGSPQYNAFMSHLLRSSDSSRCSSSNDQVDPRTRRPAFPNQKLLADVGSSLRVQATVDVCRSAKGLFQMLTALVEHANVHTAKKVSNVVISTPIFVSSHQWTTLIAPVASQAGLYPIGALGPYTNTVETAASADGYMMCQNYTYVPSCFEEIISMPFENVMVIEYTKAALSAMFSLSMDAPDHRNSFVDTDLGAASLYSNATNPSLQEVKGDSYWTLVRQRLRNLQNLSGFGHIERLVLVGEAAVNSDFVSNVRDAFADVLPPQNMLGFSSVDPIFGKTIKTRALFRPSLGGAEIAKRMMEAPEACVEAPDCVKRRKELAEK